MNGGREDEGREGVVLGLVTICQPVLSHHSCGVFVVWAHHHALVLCPRFHVIITCASFHPWL